MKPFYAARVEDLGPQDYVVVECVCGHIEKVTAEKLLKSEKVRPLSFVQDLGGLMRCTACDEKGKVLVSIRWNEKISHE